ncbi:MAG: glycosyltransferase family 2 protein [Saprospiraceae bacterium]|uniref:Glycosyltransferase family 2 protein n=1 Tax=Candidatus Opimibacter skivensis TaxID=2982028 RepID=A0A9D7SWZ4_9BACT|nr:glycosyltransferase family 2 protein [Candidatus Opimibacter skivensis]
MMNIELPKKEINGLSMLISICIPQYNRIKFLLESLRIIEQQEYPHIEIIISDDCSTDETESKILGLSGDYKYRIRYSKNRTNLGYDRNLRKAISLASGEYVIIIGNDDTINPAYNLEELVQFIQMNNYPDIGFTNYIDEGDQYITKRAQETKVLGSGPEMALKYYSCFSFVGGIVIKREVFLKYDTEKYDGSIYTQIYMACMVVASGYVLFSISAPVVIKDVLHKEKDRLSYLDFIPKKWSGYKRIDGGLPSVLHVLISALKDSGTLSQNLVYKAFRKIYFTTLPYWILEYRKQGAFPAAVGIIHGMFPLTVKNREKMTGFSQLKIFSLYIGTSAGSLVFPIGLFEKIKPKLYNWIKK